MVNKIMRQQDCQIKKNSITTEILPSMLSNAAQSFHASVSAVSNPSPNTITIKVEHPAVEMAKVRRKYK